MKMHFMVYFIGILSVLTIVKCNDEHVGKQDFISSGKDDQDDDGTLNGMNLNSDENEINEILSSARDLQKNKCGKTKQACKDAGGYCIAKSKEDDCNGKLLKGKKYCSKNKKCACCVSEEELPCIPDTCTYNDTQGLCFRDKPQGFIFRGPQECGGATGSLGCNCYTQEPLCKTSSKEKRQIQVTEYRRKYAMDSRPCVCHIDGGVLKPAQCDHYTGGANDPEWCYIISPSGVIGSYCGGSCYLPAHFMWDHTCWHCTTSQQAVDFCHGRFGNNPDSKKVNSVFKTCSDTPGEIDWALNEEGTLQSICMIKNYVMFWYCQRNDNTGWQCTDTKLCTGGGTTTGHFLLTSLHCN